MENIFSVEDLCVLISGSSRGIGLSLAQGFLEQGAKVAILSENESELELALKQLNSRFPNRVSGVVCDVRSFKSCQNAVKKVVSDLGSLTTTICNAGVDRIKPIEEYLESDWKFILEVNLQGAFYLAQAAIQFYLKNKISGSVTFTSSIAGSIGISGLVPYAASKGGTNQLTKTMAVELAPHNIRVNAVAPGYVENVMSGVTVHSNPKEQERINTFTPLGRRCQLNELVGPYIFLASQASSYVTGHILYVDGGYTAI
jgi:NAD(P)-dependent dehydrogenase (short-subunit alcohol dehydrogenase family)